MIALPIFNSVTGRLVVILIPNFSMVLYIWSFIGFISKSVLLPKELKVLLIKCFKSFKISGIVPTKSFIWSIKVGTNIYNSRKIPPKISI